jgi:hypothetical protein
MPPPSLPAAQDQAASAPSSATVRRAGKGKKVHPLPNGAAMGEDKELLKDFVVIFVFLGCFILFGVFLMSEFY